VKIIQNVKNTKGTHTHTLLHYINAKVTL